MPIVHTEKLRVNWIDTDASGRIHYTAALRYPDEFTCAARVEKVGNSSVTYGFEIRNLAGELAISGRIVAVATDPAGGKLALPESFRAALERAR